MAKKATKKKAEKGIGCEKGISEKELNKELEEIEQEVGVSGDEIDREITIKASKPISKIVKGDKIKVDGREFDVDSHYVLIDHAGTKEMAIEVFDSKTDTDFQVRYFNDQAERTLDFYELQGEIMFVKKPFKKIEW